jgi:short subunit dehydrogenase-like uncharacterized protein
MASEILIYGATGYTAKLIIALARERGADLVLAGRSETGVRQIAKSNNMDARVFGLDDRDGLDAALSEVAVVLHCAGPFSHTSKQMVDACIRNRRHYLDITGEIDVFEACAARSAAAADNGVMLLPGVGFDVVPSDCLAAHVASKVAAPNRLTLAIAGLNKRSRGTARTGVEGIGRGLRVRRGGQIVRLKNPIRREIAFGNRNLPCMTLSWGDVATAYYSTGAKDIEVLFESVPEIDQFLKLSQFMRFLLATGPAQKMLKRWIDKQPEGPDARERAQGSATIFAEVVDVDGASARAILRMGDAYSFTADSALTVAMTVASGNHKPGFQTPSQVFGADFVLGLKDVTREDIN